MTEIKAGKGRAKNLRVLFDGGRTLELLAEVVLSEGLETGQELSGADIDRLEAADHQRRCLNAAMRLLAYRPRSESEIKKRLLRLGFETQCVEKTMTDLKEKGLVDDVSFAVFWKENRETFRPRSRRAVSRELKRQGLADGVIETALADMDDSASAYRLALARARRLPREDYQEFRRQLGAYLARRGFDWDTIDGTVMKVWRESASQP